MPAAAGKPSTTLFTGSQKVAEKLAHDLNGKVGPAARVTLHNKTLMSTEPTGTRGSASQGISNPMLGRAGEGAALGDASRERRPVYAICF